MPIKRRLQIVAWVCVISTLGLGVAVILTAYQKGEATRSLKNTHEVVRGLFDLTILAYQHEVHSDLRAQQQFMAQYRSFGTLLHRLSPGSVEDKRRLVQLLSRYRELKAVTAELFLSQANEPSSDQGPRLLNKSRQALKAMLLRGLESMVREASFLHRSSQERLQKLQYRSLLATIVFGLFVGIVLAGTFVWINRSIARPLSELTRDTEVLGAGNLVHLSQITTKDEIGDLAQAFNRMALRLKGSYRAMELEIAERKAAQAELEKHRLFLEEMVEERAGELAKTNEDLRAELIWRNQAETTLTAHAGELERLNSELKRYAYIASHHLQEPLRMVSSFVQLLGNRYKGKLDPQADRWIEYAMNGTNRMSSLLNDLLECSFIDALNTVIEPVDVETVLQEVRTRLQRLIEESGVQVTHDPLPTIHADASQFARLLYNLVSNAIKFRGEEDPHVHISTTQQGPEWVFSVEDNGIGIKPEHRERIFELFQTLHPSYKFAGTGLGLAICKKIVEHHGGRIWVESEPGRGSKFFFSLPQGGKRNGN